ncbi:BsuPI-related putative proteinase inhibitor [Bacillus sp. FJAT-45350]|uniref:BsuPI-related putative proteinase inhibitor n=1 Tax=Bacillus sp. FJAT-45350 TaxID=2011014 RepID=UPI000BB8D54F|nr:BsuPI-related putative proteinase inhibitor [Bacillus sp. FJAT-45350]
MRIVTLLFIIGFLLTGCGVGSEQTSEDETSNENVNEIVAGEMSASLTEERPLVFQYQVTNQTENVVTLNFSSSQRIDFSVETKTGDNLFLFSSVATFLQTLGKEEIIQGESLEFEITLHDINLSQGEYILAAWMTPKDGETYKVTKEFIVR